MAPRTSSELMTPAEVAAVFHVNPKTVTRWAIDGRLPSIRTLGGHRRFRRADVEAAKTERDTPAAVVSSTAGLASLRAGASIAGGAL